MTVTIIVTDGKGNVIAEKKYGYYEERARNITVLGSWIVVRSGLMLSIMDSAHMCTYEYLTP